MVGLFAEMKMGGKCVLEQMNEEISSQDKKKCWLTCKAQRFGQYLDKSGGQHESGAQREKIFQVHLRPVSTNQNITAEDICCGGCQSECYCNESSRVDGVVHRKFLAAMTEQDHIAFLHNVILSFQADGRSFTGCR